MRFLRNSVSGSCRPAIRGLRQVAIPGPGREFSRFAAALALLAWAGPPLAALGAPAHAQAPGECRRLNLAGNWRFAADPKDQGVRERWFLRKLKGNIHLPGSTDEAGVGGPGPERLGVLTRRHEYLGPAWYQREIVLPPDWSGLDVSLFLERVLWQSRAWLDGRELGPPLDSWAAPHIHPLGRVAPGRHRLTVRIDNRMIHPLGRMSTSYGIHTQTIWNGIIGRIELQGRPRPHLTRVRVFPRQGPKGWSVELEVHLDGENLAGVRLTAGTLDPDAAGRPLGPPVSAIPKQAIVRLQLPCTTAVRPWDEFHPKLYEVRITLARAGAALQQIRRRFGFRTIRHAGNRLLLNGEPLFLRGNLDCCHFPLTGYPSTRKSDWLRIFRLYKAYGLNHVRFHTWCPPEAAFEAADELGIYVQASAGIWINHGAGEGDGPGKHDRTVDRFTQAEMRRVVDTFGNHPSFILMVIGNELGHSNFKVTGRWIQAIKAYDPRRLYAASTARTITPYDDFSATHRVPGIGWVRQHLVNNTDWDYEDKYRRTRIPIIAHEIGQWPVYPEWNLCEKFRGVLRNTRLEKMREAARRAGIYAQQPDFTAASGAISQRLYKDEIESFLRTPSCRGFQLLSMEDFQGQGEAYVGWLDMFWDDKGITTPERFRGHCAPVVALARLPAYTWTAGETFHCRILLRNDGPGPLRTPQILCRILEHPPPGRRPPAPSPAGLFQQRLTGPDAPKGAVLRIGEIRVPWARVLAGRRPPVRLDLELSGPVLAAPNRYPLWVYPAASPTPAPAPDLVETGDPDVALRALARGKKVLLEAAHLGDPDIQPKLAAWRPLYWSLAFFHGQAETLGLLVNSKSPVFRDFPTENFGDWQWYDICRNAHGFDLTGITPAAYRPAAQPVPDFHAPRRIGTLFEFRVGPGRLFVCGYDLSPDRCRRYPAVRQLRFSLERYLRSAEFAPRVPLKPTQVRALFPHVENAVFCPPPDRAQAVFYLDCGGRHRRNWVHTQYRTALDDLQVARPGWSYTVTGLDGVWRDPHCSAWIIGGGKTARLVLHTPRRVQGTLYLHFSDWNHNRRRGRILAANKRIQVRLGRHDQRPEGVWTAFEILQRYTRRGELDILLRHTAGSNLMLTSVVFVPSKPD